MATIVVGRNLRSVGKTSVIAALIASQQGCHWTAIKMTQHPHGDYSTSDACEILEEKSLRCCKDTSHYLAAGAARSLFFRVRRGRLAAAMQTLRPILESRPFLIIERGDGSYGSGAAARTYFRHSGLNLSGQEAAALAAAIINPRRYSPFQTSKRIQNRIPMIGARMRKYRYYKN
jgi:hypothetical protein